MTLQETMMLLEILNTAYPRFYTGPEAPDKKQAAKLWFEMFREDDFRLVAGAVKAFIATDTKGYPPHIGAIKGKLRQLTMPQEETEQEAWGKVYRSICNSGYDAEREFAALPPLIQGLVGSPQQLREWAMMDVETTQSVVASNFQRSYRARVQHQRDWEAMPENVKELSRTVAECLQSPEEKSLSDSPAIPPTPKPKPSPAEIREKLRRMQEELSWAGSVSRREESLLSDEEIAKRREENMRRLREEGGH